MLNQGPVVENAFLSRSLRSHTPVVLVVYINKLSVSGVAMPI